MPAVPGRHRFRKLKRYRQIISRLAFYGFAETGEALGLRRRGWFSRQVEGGPRGRRVRQLSFGARLRLLFETLGPTFIKLGQFMSLRSDLLPEEITSELEKLQYGAAPLPFAKIEPVLVQELGADWRQRFRSVDEEPFASASIAQVHRAVAVDGEQLALKIQRPGIAATIRADMAILRDLAALLERHLARTRMYHPVRLIEHFTRVLSLELDFNYEGRTMELCRRNFRGDPDVYIPKVRHDLSTERLLAMEYIEGVRLSDPQRLEEARVDTRRIARVGAKYVLAQVFRDGVYNADPHPANFIVRPDGVLVAIDFGMVGVLDPEMKQALVTLLMCVLNRDPGRLVRLFAGLHLIDETVSTDELREDLGRLIHFYHMPVGHLSVTRLLQDLNAVMRAHRVELPADLALTLKVLMTLESLLRRLDPELNVLEVARSFAARVRVGRLGELFNREAAAEAAEDTARLLRSLPWQTQELLEKARTGRLKVRIDFEDLGRTRAGDRPLDQPPRLLGGDRGGRCRLLADHPQRSRPVGVRAPGDRPGRLRHRGRARHLVPHRHDALGTPVGGGRPAGRRGLSRPDRTKPGTIPWRRSSP